MLSQQLHCIYCRLLTSHTAAVDSVSFHFIVFTFLSCQCVKGFVNLAIRFLQSILCECEWLMQSDQCSGEMLVIFWTFN